MPSFVERVLASVSRIPSGHVSTYADIARAIGAGRASRAVGSACGKNPHLVVVPCHRVVRSDGRVGGYAGGVNKKIMLLKKEGVQVKYGKVDLRKFRFSLPLPGGVGGGR